MEEMQFSFTQVKKRSEVVWRDQVCGWVARVALVEIAVMVGLLGWRFTSLPPEIPLWLGRPWGAAQLARPIWVWILPGLTLVWLLVSMMIGGMVYGGEKLAARVLLVAAGLMGFLATMSTVKILLLVG